MTPQIGKKLEKGERVNMVGLCNVMGVSHATILNLLKEGLPHTGGKGRSYVFNTAECIDFKVKYDTLKIHEQYEHLAPDPEAQMSIAEAKRRREVALALKAELELANEREQVANIEDLVGLFRDALVNVRANLTSMSSRLAGVLSHQDEDAVAKLLDAEVNDILENVSNYKAE